MCPTERPTRRALCEEPFATVDWAGQGTIERKLQEHSADSGFALMAVDLEENSAEDLQQVGSDESILAHM